MRHSEIPLMQLLFCVGGLGIGIKHDALELVDGIIVGVSSSRIIFKSKKKKKSLKMQTFFLSLSCVQTSKRKANVHVSVILVTGASKMETVQF